MFSLISRSSRSIRTISVRHSTSSSTALSPLETTLRSALKVSMKAKTAFRTTVIKSLLADLQTASHLAGAAPAQSKTLARSIAARIDGAAIFVAGARQDLADTYLEEAAILQEFVEAQEVMSESELEAVVREVVGDVAPGKEIGKVIKAVVARVGEKATGKAVSEMVRKIAAEM